MELQTTRITPRQRAACVDTMHALLFSERRGRSGALRRRHGPLTRRLVEDVIPVNVPRASVDDGTRLEYSSARTFWYLVDELARERAFLERFGLDDHVASFYGSRHQLLDAHERRRLFTLALTCEHPDVPREALLPDQKTFPALVVLAPDRRTVQLVWVAPRVRRCGLGTRLVSLIQKQLQADSDANDLVQVECILEEARPFWNSIPFVRSWSTDAATDYVDLYVALARLCARERLPNNVSKK